MLTYIVPFCKHTSHSSSKPLLVYFPGLSATPLPSHQLRRVNPHYDVISITETPDTDWDTLVQHVHSQIPPAENVTLVGESFGAALAIRLSLLGGISRLVLINSATAIVHQKFLSAITALFPILSIDPTETFLYSLAGVFLYQFLVDESRLDTACIPAVKSVDIGKVPLTQMLRKVSLLRNFEDSFSEKCYQLIQTPTTLVASVNDRLFDSVGEMNRLKNVLPNLEKRVLLPESAHAALMERDVDLLSLLHDDVPDPEKQDYDAAISTGRRVFNPWKSLTSPVLFGTHHVSKGLRSPGPIIFVGNHTIYGLLDVSVFYLELVPLLGTRRLSSLADPIHFDFFSDISDGKWKHFVQALGGLPATPRNYYRLLSRGECVLLFPGGAREVCRRRNEQYKLFWKDETDFIRPAAKFNATVIPFSAVGADDSVDILLDGQEVQSLPVLGSMVKNFLDERKLSKENLMPIGTFPPRPERLYFKFHPGVDLRDVDSSDATECKRVYRNIKNTVQTGIDELLQERQHDPYRRFGERLAKDFLGTLLPDWNV